jgi:regulator of protease activity HflC (stomatin/prohibitin superfamily)
LVFLPTSPLPSRALKPQFRYLFKDPASQHSERSSNPRQDVTQALNERPQALIQANTQLLQANQFAEQTLINAEAAAEVILANALAEARSINATLSAQLIAYQGVLQVFLGFLHPFF